MKKRAQNSLYSFWSAAIIVCAVLALFAVLFSLIMGGHERQAKPVAVEEPVESTLPDETDVQATPTPDPMAPSTSAAALAETEDAGAAYVDEIFFLGDDALNYMKNGMLTGANTSKQIWTPESGTLPLQSIGDTRFVSPVTGNTVPASEIVEVNQPKYLIILPSPDNGNMVSEDELKSGLAALISSIQEQSPDTKIIVSSLTPIAASYEYEDLTNEIIGRINGWIAEAAETAGVGYLDAGAGLVNQQGYLPESYQDNDGLHLNANGINAWLDYVKTHAYPA